jgi:thiamine pyrophosphokinase
MKQFLTYKKTLIVANGEKPTPALLQRYLGYSKTIIALDGAVDWLINFAILPDIVIGDMDSINSKNKKNDQLNFLEITEQNSNDLEKAFIYCLEKGLLQVSVLAAFGMRIDHFLTNIFVLNKFSLTMTITFVDDQQCAFICPKNRSLMITGAKDSYISLFPLNDQVGPVYLDGVEYQLNNEILSLSSRVGTLNKITAHRATIRCESNNLLVIIPNFSLTDFFH